MASYLSLCQEFSLLSTILSTIALTYVRSSVISSCFKLHSIHIFETKVKSIEFPRTTWNVQTSFFCFHSLLCLLVIELRLLTRSMNFLFKKKASIIYTLNGNFIVVTNDLKSTLLAKIMAFLFMMRLHILINALLDCGDSSFKIDGEYHLEHPQEFYRSLQIDVYTCRGRVLLPRAVAFSFTCFRLTTDKAWPIWIA